VKKILLLASALTVATPTAFAQSYSRFYLGGGTGFSKITQNYGSLEAVQAAPGSTGVSADRGSTPVRAFFGFKFSPNFGLEGGYQMFGTFGARQTTPTGTYDASWKVKGGYVDAIAFIPMGDAMNFGLKLGAIRATTDAKLSSPSSDSTTSENKFALRYGAALQVDFSRWFSFRADADVNRGATKGTQVGLTITPLDYTTWTGSLLLRF